jgi:diguanylate cyclase (GGDEF)-like protein
MSDDVNELRELIRKLKIFEKIYQGIRIVDPLEKKVLNLSENAVCETGDTCYDFWRNNAICDNCISMRAYNENETVVKVEHTPDASYVVTAIPILHGDRRMVVELLKDATRSFYAGSTPATGEIHPLIRSMNNIAVRDPLTGVYNRRFIGERLPVDMIHECASGRYLTLVMTDIDHFADINDHYGHQAGDMVLKSVAEKLSICVRRESDWVARSGGEEFMVCLTDTPKEAGESVAERMRKTIEEMALHFKGASFNVTSSFGLCCIGQEDEISVDEFISNTDRKLYDSKLHGRNRVSS